MSVPASLIFTFENVGIRIPASTATTAITVRSSIKVKADSLEVGIRDGDVVLILKWYDYLIEVFGSLGRATRTRLPFVRPRQLRPRARSDRSKVIFSVLRLSHSTILGIFSHHALNNRSKVR